LNSNLVTSITLHKQTKELTTWFLKIILFENKRLKMMWKIRIGSK
jgi:hypothetical protein